MSRTSWRGGWNGIPTDVIVLIVVNFRMDGKQVSRNDFVTSLAFAVHTESKALQRYSDRPWLVTFLTVEILIIIDTSLRFLWLRAVPAISYISLLVLMTNLLTQNILLRWHCCSDVLVSGHYKGKTRTDLLPFQGVLAYKYLARHGAIGAVSTST